MPELITFHGRPVKHWLRATDGIRLTFVSPVRGEQGRILVVSHDEWLRYGRTRFLAKSKMPNLRRLALSFLV